MVQSVNLQGIAHTLKLVWHPRAVVPHVIVPDFRYINFKDLYESGFRAVAIDKDNCLTAPYETELHPPFREAWENCKQLFGENIVVVSNSAGTLDDVGDKQAHAIEQSLGVPVLRHKSKKPGCIDELLAHLRSTTPLSDEFNPHRTVVIGDRILTDVVFGNRLGGFTILTRDLVSEKGDNPVAVKIRRMEHMLVDLLARQGVKPPKHPLELKMTDL
ncbi:uncharacterized protein VTP21DRAFT_11467 [Calcarisporiella thermophila]|uniref:uncharacterized protein n=1 Tax=Calcarisporiella thermophila TaxID=911321 RepID=UPI00374259D8